MKIKLPKPVSRDPNALDAKSRKSAGPFRSKKPRQKISVSDYYDELFEEMQGEEMAEKMKAAFNATTEEMGRAAVEGAKDAIKKRKISGDDFS